MKALGSVGVPVPKTLSLCEDSRLVNNFNLEFYTAKLVAFLLLSKIQVQVIQIMNLRHLSPTRQPGGIFEIN